MDKRDLNSDVSSIFAGPNAPTWALDFTPGDREPLTRDEVGYLCVVWLKDGSRMVGTPQRSATRGKFDIMGYAGHADALGQSGASATRVDAIRPQQLSARKASALAA